MRQMGEGMEKKKWRERRGQQEKDEDETRRWGSESE